MGISVLIKRGVYRRAKKKCGVYERAEQNGVYRNAKKKCDVYLCDKKSGVYQGAEKGWVKENWSIHQPAEQGEDQPNN